MRLDVSKFFTDISHDISLSEIPAAHEALCGKPTPKTLMREWEKEIVAFLQRIPGEKDESNHHHKTPPKPPPHARLPAVSVHDSRLRAIEVAFERRIEKRLAALEKK